MRFPDVRVSIVRSEDGTTPMLTGEVGEIVISAPLLMKGYWNRPSERLEMLRTDERGQRALYTGDLGYMDEDGYMFIVDRKKDLIKTCGFQVWPREIEEVISSHPAVAEVGVIGVPHQMRGEVVKASVVLRPGHSATPSALKFFCRDRLVRHKLPPH